MKIPLCLSIEPSNICNFKCAMCFHGNNEQDEKAGPFINMDWKIFEKTICDLKAWTKAASEKIKLVKLYSLGEPLLHPGLTDMVKEIKEAGLAEQIEITTNGFLLTEEVSIKLILYGLDTIRFSIYGVDEEYHRRITKSSVSVDDIFRNVKFLYEERNRRGKNKPKILAKMFDAGSEVNSCFLKRYGEVADIAGIDEIFNVDVGDGKNVFENYYGSEEKSYEEPMHLKADAAKRPCRYPFTHMTIRSDGNVVSCCSDWQKELRIGNVMEHSLQELWESRSLYQIRKQMLKTQGQCFKACRSCGIPYRDLSQDSITDVKIDRFGYENDF